MEFCLSFENQSTSHLSVPQWIASVLDHSSIFLQIMVEEENDKFVHFVVVVFEQL